MSHAKKVTTTVPHLVAIIIQMGIVTIIIEEILEEEAIVDGVGDVVVEMGDPAAKCVVYLATQLSLAGIISTTRIR